MRDNLVQPQGSTIGLLENGNSVEDTLNDIILVGKQKTSNLFDFLSVEKINSVKAGTVTDVTTELQNAMDGNNKIEIPKGNYLVTKTINVGVNSGLTGPGPMDVNIDNQGTGNLFNFPSGYTRGVREWSGFSVKSSTKTAINSYAFYYTGSLTTGVLEYACGQKFYNIEIDGTGMGGGWYIQDAFRVIIRDCGASGLSNPLSIIGNVVQLTVDNLINNGDNAPTITSAANSYGIYMAGKSYTDGHGTKTPEGILILNSRFVLQNYGAIITGLYITIRDTEFDYSTIMGVNYHGGSEVLLDNIYIGVYPTRENDFIGFFVPAMASGVAEAVTITNSTVNMSTNLSSNSAKYNSYGVQVGNSTVPMEGVVINNNTFRGDGYTSGVYIYNSISSTINSNRFQFTGVNINVKECLLLTMIGNTGDGKSNYTLSTANNNSRWMIANNTESFATFSTVNPSGVFALNQKMSSSNYRRISHATSPVNTTVAANGSYQHTVTINTATGGTANVGGDIPAGLIFSATYSTSTSVVITFYNPTNSTVSLSGNLYVDFFFPPL